jgi:hypothetical protein
MEGENAEVRAMLKENDRMRLIDGFVIVSTHILTVFSHDKTKG